MAKLSCYFHKGQKSGRVVRRPFVNFMKMIFNGEINFRSTLHIYFRCVYRSITKSQKRLVHKILTSSRLRFLRISTSEIRKKHSVTRIIRAVITAILKYVPKVSYFTRCTEFSLRRSFRRIWCKRHIDTCRLVKRYWTSPSILHWAAAE